MDYTQVLLRPLISEKATFLKDSADQVVFLVHPGANKIEIKKAVEQTFNVKVADVNVANRKSEPKTRGGRVVGRLSGYRKAYVKLIPGQKIEFFEGV